MDLGWGSARARSHLYQRPDSRRAILLPYAACCVVALALLPFQRGVQSLGVPVIQLVRRVETLLDHQTSLAQTDDLTGLPNRRAWQELLSRQLAVAARAEEQISVALLDLDFFKRYNDSHGHLAGDRLLLL